MFLEQDYLLISDLATPFGETDFFQETEALHNSTTQTQPFVSATLPSLGFLSFETVLGQFNFVAQNF